MNRHARLVLCVVAALTVLTGCRGGSAEPATQSYGGLVVVLDEQTVAPTGTLSYRIENQTDRQWALTQLPSFDRKESSGAWQMLPGLRGAMGGAQGGGFTVDSQQATDWIDVPLQAYGLETGRHRIRLAVREPVRNVIVDLFAEFDIED